MNKYDYHVALITAKTTEAGLLYISGNSAQFAKLLFEDFLKQGEQNEN